MHTKHPAHTCLRHAFLRLLPPALRLHHQATGTVAVARNPGTPLAISGRHCARHMIDARSVRRVGESGKEISARFGEGSLSDRQRQPGAQTFKYFKNGFQIEVVIHNGKCIWEIYHKQSGSGAFPEADIKNLLDSYKEPAESKRS